MILLSKKQQEALIQAGYRYACALSSDPDSSRDLVHDAWISITKRYGSRPDKALLFRVIRNRYIDHYRRAARFSHVDFDDQDMTTHDAAGGMSGLIDPDGEQLSRSLETLRSEEREALFLSVVEGYTAAEIAELSNRSRGTVLSQIHRAKAKLKLLLMEGSSEPGSSASTPETTSKAAQIISIKAGRTR
ncbi:MAG: RNA polymerase sigma factor [Granulosicoccus sp.]